MNHTQFFAACGAGQIRNVYLFEGEEELTKASALDALRNACLKDTELPEMNETVLTDPDADTLIAACETLPFLSERRLVTVRECAMLIPNGKTKEYDADDAAERLKEYLPGISQTTCLVFYVRGKADSRRKLYGAVKKCGETVQFDTLDENELAKWIIKRFRLHGKNADAAAAQALWFTSGKDLTLLSNEIDKISAYAGDQDTVTETEIAAVATQTTEYKVFDLADTLLSGNGKKAFSLLRMLERDGEQSVYLLSLLGRQCRQMLYVRDCRDPYTAARRLGIPSGAASALMRMGKAYSAEQTEQICRLCTETEYRIKSGELNESGALENVMLRILAMFRKQDNSD